MAPDGPGTPESPDFLHTVCGELVKYFNFFHWHWHLPLGTASGSQPAAGKNPKGESPPATGSGWPAGLAGLPLGRGPGPASGSGLAGQRPGQPTGLGAGAAGPPGNPPAVSAAAVAGHCCPGAATGTQ
jgi:hypothetical protein